ncbi:hypothetical protein Sango_1853900 [Sesamum angolense]|uniref:J domain-containing protein n=1 Tax=Sesamum angolense TaxID=2727404 RepID=A0AAE2BQ95_9LAMI|nr:hypothetical protein Sango_1853900 [Sesamum angolense]
MQVLPRWRNVLIVKNTIAQSTSIVTTHVASFHSTDAVFEKWKNKFSFDVRGEQQPSKNYIRYAVRQKRADTKRALKSIFFNGGCSTSRDESFAKIEADYADQLNKKSRIKSARQAKRTYHKKLKRKHRKENMFEDYDENPARIFRATFGKQGFTWTFRPSEMGFDWTGNFGWGSSRFNEQDSKSRTESDAGSFILGTYADRKILGLPTAGPLKIEDVKAAFRLSALKWHPDKHQRFFTVFDSQTDGKMTTDIFLLDLSGKVDAEEKFKHCVNAYKSLCNAFSTS